MTNTPNKSELTVLKALWQQGPSSAREVHDQVGPANSWSPSTTRTLLERMREKGLVSRKSVHGMAVYTPAHEKVGLLGRIIKDIASRVFEIDGPVPASAFANSKLLSTEELAQLEALLQTESQPASQNDDEDKDGAIS